ncbi:MAG: hypothetical protein RRY06_05505 [Lachnospiraceae bacterium]
MRCNGCQYKHYCPGADFSTRCKQFKRGGGKDGRTDDNSRFDGACNRSDGITKDSE